ncbi:hypothetical protein DFH07DRAFT_951168 [Mycena maculata]|uniref:DNA-directed RNA polymerase n=1 Tax=Mycena maculata TaxID=230809 RepID=A0AAD7NW51_9AGAR|nr:hypothetical protein DFH07DRAFT_951168 [Mycena maculata]
MIAWPIHRPTKIIPDKSPKKYDIIQLDGLAPPRTRRTTRQLPGGLGALQNTPMTYKSLVAGNIDKIVNSGMENEQALIKVLIRQTRQPELGDKFPSRHGQTGVWGLIVNQDYMPFNKQGINPEDTYDAGKDMLTSGITGELREAYVYFGPIYYQPLLERLVISSDKFEQMAQLTIPYAAELLFQELMAMRRGR